MTKLPPFVALAGSSYTQFFAYVLSIFVSYERDPPLKPFCRCMALGVGLPAIGVHFPFQGNGHFSGMQFVDMQRRLDMQLCCTNSLS